MVLSESEVSKDAVEIAAARCPECHLNLRGECSTCGAMNPSGHKFCSNCGTALTGSPSPAGLLKHAVTHWESEAKATELGVDALRRWHMVVGFSV